MRGGHNAADQEEEAEMDYESALPHAQRLLALVELMDDIDGECAERCDLLIRDLTAIAGGSRAGSPEQHERIVGEHMEALKRLIDEMRRNPKKYFKVNVMDF